MDQASARRAKAASWTASLGGVGIAAKVSSRAESRAAHLAKTPARTADAASASVDATGNIGATQMAWFALDQLLAEKVTGMLLDPRSESPDQLAAVSPNRVCPHVCFAPRCGGELPPDAERLFRLALRRSPEPFPPNRRRGSSVHSHRT